MNLLLISPVFPPEIGSSAQIYYDLATGFCNKGHTVHVLTSYPRYYNLPDDVLLSNIPLDETDHGINIHRVQHHAPGVENMILRGGEHFYMPFFYFRRYKSLRKELGIKFDACIIHSPPLPFCYLAQFIKKYDGTPSIINYQDFHPGELIKAGVVKNQLWIKILEHIEHKAYTQADFITSHSRGGIEYMVARGANPNKIANIFNSVDLNVLDNPNIISDYKLKENIEDKYLISFAGRIMSDGGYDRILNVAHSLQDVTEIVFYIVGNGPYKQELERLIHERKITNITTRNFLPRDEYINLIKSSDLSIVSLDQTDSCPCFPGKIMNIMALKRPILAFLSSDSDAAKTILEANAGIIISTETVPEIRDKILNLKDHLELCIEYGEKGREFVLNNMTLDVATSRYESIIQNLN
ncbi:MAG: glycosyltransferase family 4 protein [Methanocorpusculum sp.]|uniref:glycosyltransferase family 4 protein n=1 Tax=Methanocorpusculum sp. TaxID=2058474 RepID=UPI002718EEB3|nr:glycosyltransferase family 4 protein [Methanocorpusculum sp.]MDO9523818.1 glycosyltransferase family 4 protein [Methanocorpusculum sp.]